MTLHGITFPQNELAEFCQRNHIRKLSLFGSILRDDFTAKSDVDVLVEFEPGQTPGFGFVRIQEELSQLIGRRVDLNTPQCLSKYFVDEVLQVAEVVFVAA